LPPKTIWAKSHIREVQDAIKATCDTTTFAAIPTLWKQSILDEIRDKLGQAFCKCKNGGPEPCSPANVRNEDGTVFVLLSNGPAKVFSNCLGNNTPPVALAAMINGMAVGRSGIIDRQWQVFRTNHSTGAKIRVTAGVISCEGLAIYAGTVMIPTVVGIEVFCADCGTVGCATAHAEAADELTNPENYNVYTLEIDSAHAACHKCS